MLSSKSIRESSGDFAEQGIQSRMMFMSFAPMRIGKLEGWFIYQYMLVEAPRLKTPRVLHLISPCIIIGARNVQRPCTSHRCMICDSLLLVSSNERSLSQH